jgi:hypothetical protein
MKKYTPFKYLHFAKSSRNNANKCKWSSHEMIKTLVLASPARGSLISCWLSDVSLWSVSMSWNKSFSDQRDLSQGASTLPVDTHHMAGRSGCLSETSQKWQQDSWKGGVIKNVDMWVGVRCEPGLPSSCHFVFVLFLQQRAVSAPCFNRQGPYSYKQCVLSTQPRAWTHRCRWACVSGYTVLPLQEAFPLPCWKLASSLSLYRDRLRTLLLLSRHCFPSPFLCVPTG